MAIKGKMLADLVAEFTEYPKGAIAKEDESMGAHITTITVLGPLMWKLYVDGVAADIVFCTPLICVPDPRKSKNIIFSLRGCENI